MLRTDYELTLSEVPLLASWNVLIAIFARPGYLTNTWLPQTLTAMVIIPESLKVSMPLQHTERLDIRDSR